MKAPRKFKGALASPIYWRPASALDWGLLETPTDEQIRSENIDRFSDALTRAFAKLPLLAAAYDIDLEAGERADNYALLAFCLACEFVPGFKVSAKPVRRRGRPRVWTDSRQRQLIADVEAIKAQRSCGDREALSALLRQEAYFESWGRYRPKGKTADAAVKAINAMEARLSEARREQRTRSEEMGGLLGSISSIDWHRLATKKVDEG